MIPTEPTNQHSTVTLAPLMHTLQIFNEYRASWIWSTADLNHVAQLLYSQEKDTKIIDGTPHCLATKYADTDKRTTESGFLAMSDVLTFIRENRPMSLPMLPTGIADPQHHLLTYRLPSRRRSTATMYHGVTD